MDEGTKTIALGPRGRKASTEDEDQNCVVANKVQDAATVQDTDKLIRSTQNRRRKTLIVIIRDDDDIDLR